MNAEWATLTSSSITVALAPLHFAFIFLFLILFVRSIPWPKEWLTRKPLSCDACMTGWTCIFAAAPWLIAGRDFGELGLTAGYTMLLLAVHRKLTDTWAPPT